MVLDEHIEKDYELDMDTTVTDATSTEWCESSVSLGGLSVSNSKLYLDQNSLFGRNKETTAFRQVLARVRRRPSAPEFVLVHGNSGCGKSALVRHLQKEESASEDLIWVDGKYDQFDHGSQPFGAIAEATSELLRKMNQVEIDALLESIDEKDISLLAKVVNSFKVFLSDDHNAEEDTEAVNEHALTTFSKLYGKFLAVICSSRTVVMFLDDLQWCDSVSAKLLVSIASDGSLGNLLLVGGRRDDDECTFHLPQSSNMNINRIKVFPLGISGTKQLVATAVGSSLDDTTELATTLHSKAGGNPFFVVQMLENLVQTRILKRDASGVFSWKMSKVVENTNVGDNIVKLLLSRINALPRTTQAVLFVAAQWGFRFRIELVETAFRSTEFLEVLGFDEDHVDVTVAMAKAIVCGLVEKSRHGTYRFTHDRVQQMAIALVASRETETNFTAIMEHFGLLLFQMTQKLTKENHDSTLFTALRVLQSHPSISFTEMAMLCRKGAMVSVRMAAFEQALQYAESGIHYLEDTREGAPLWSEHYGIALDLFTVSAEMHFVAGNMEMSKERIVCITQNAINPRHTIRAQLVMLDMLAQEGKWLDCTKAGTKYLRHYGIRVDPNSGPMALAWNVLKTKLLLGGRSAKDLKSLPTLQDPVMVQVVRLLGKINASSWVSQKDETVLVSSLHMLRVTLKHGFSPLGVFAVATYGNVVALVDGDHEAAWDFADLSIELAEKRLESARPIISFPLTMYLSFYRRGIAWSIPWLRKAIETGIQDGDIMGVAASFWALSSLLLYTSPLPTRKLFARLGRQFFLDYKQDSWFELFRPWAQLSETLETGGTSLNGAFFRVDEFLSCQSKEEYQPNSQEVKLVNVVHYTQIFLFTILCDYESLLEEYANYKGAAEFGPFLPKITNYFHLALSFIALARERASKKYKRKAIRYAAKVREFTSGRAPFLHGMNTLLAAEEKSMKSKTTTDKDELYTMYTKAAKLFEEDECTLYHAIALEKAGDFCITIGANERGHKFLLEAYELFAEFGVVSKLPLLKRKYLELVDDAENLPESSLLQIQAPFSA